VIKNRFTEGYFKAAADYIASRTSMRPGLAIVLGSCLGDFASQIEGPVTIDYKDIPNFLVSTVASHAGKLIFGKLNGNNIVCLSGRFHFYEGYDYEDLVIPVRVLKLLGVKALILTNAAGGINEGFVPGDLMMIKDHIEFSGASPLRGRNLEEFGPRFFDVTDMYTAALQGTARMAAEKTGVALKEGIYFYRPGPQFETPAEIRALRLLGADAVGMSTVTEALTAAHAGIKVLAISLITNMAAGMAAPVSTQEVSQTAQGSAARFRLLITEIVKQIGL
jgi:purine-nucleoside phosphorylase